MKKQTVLFCAVLVAIAQSAPHPGGHYRQHYQFEQSSASYKNNELQHKNEEAGKYTKFGDLDGTEDPQESSSYRQSEYRAPCTEGCTTKEDLSVVGLTNSGRPQQSVNSWSSRQSSSRHYSSHSQSGLGGKVDGDNDGQTQQQEDLSQQFQNLNKDETATQLAGQSGSRRYYSSHSQYGIRGKVDGSDGQTQQQEDLSQQFQNLNKDETATQLAGQSGSRRYYSSHSQYGIRGKVDGSDGQTQQQEDLSQQFQNLNKDEAATQLAGQSGSRRYYSSSSQYGTGGKLDGFNRQTQQQEDLTKQFQNLNKDEATTQLAGQSGSRRYYSSSSQHGIGGKLEGFDGQTQQQEAVGQSQVSTSGGRVITRPVAFSYHYEPYEGELEAQGQLEGQEEGQGHRHGPHGRGPHGHGPPGHGPHGGEGHRHGPHGNGPHGHGPPGHGPHGRGHHNHENCNHGQEHGHAHHPHHQNHHRHHFVSETQGSTNQGFGRDYWANTEGQWTSSSTGTNTADRPTTSASTTENIKPVFEDPEPSTYPILPSASQTGQTSNDKLKPIFDQIDAIANMDRGRTQIHSNTNQYGTGLIDERNQQNRQNGQTMIVYTSSRPRTYGQGVQYTGTATQTTQSGFGTHQTGQSGFGTQQTAQSQFGRQPTDQSQFGGQQTTQSTQFGHQTGLSQMGGVLINQSQFRGQNSGQSTNQQIGQTQFTGQQTEDNDDLTQQTQDGFSKFEFGGQEQEDLTQQTQDGFGKLEFAGQQDDLTQQTQHGFDNLEFGSQTQNMNQQSQTSFSQHKDMTQQQQGGVGIGIVMNQKPKNTAQPKKKDDEEDQSLKKLEFTGENEEENITEDNLKNNNEKLESDSQHRQQTNQNQQISVGQQNTGNQHRQTIGQQNTQYRQTQTQSTVNRQTQYNNQNRQTLSDQQQNSERTDSGNHHQIQYSHQGVFNVDSDEDLTQQHEDQFGGQEHEDLTQQQEDLTQQLQSGFNFESQHQQGGRLEDMSQHTQQVQTGYGKLEFGQQHESQEDLTQKTQSGFDFGHSDKLEDLSQHTQQQTGFGKLEFGQQHEDQEDLTQQTQSGFEFGNHGKLEDMSQHNQQQTGFGKLEFGQQHKNQEDLTQQTQSGFEFGSHDKLEDLSQHSQSQVGYGKLDFGQQHEDLTQQQTDEFGKLEFGVQKPEDLTQQTQDGFGKLEFGNQQGHVTQSGSNSFSHSSSSSASSSFSSSSSRSFSSNSSGYQRQQSHGRAHSGSPGYSGQLNYGTARHIADEKVEELPDDDSQKQIASEVYDVSQQVQKVQNLHLEPQKEHEDFNQRSTQEILANGQLNVDEEQAIVTEDKPSEKPGFWKRVGGSIVTSYDKAKEKIRNIG